MTEERLIAAPARSETRRTISPYDLTSSDNPGAIISYPLLDGKNYDEWALSFKTALCSRKKFGFLDGAIPKPAKGSADYDDWIPINALLVSWIKMSIHESLRSSVSHREIAKDLWDSLKQRFSISNGPRLQQLKNEIALCKQNGQSVENYYGRMCKIWDCLSVIQPIRKCSCGRCTCDLMSQLEKDREDDRVQQFLYGVDEHLQSIRSSLVSRTPLPRVEEAYNLLRQEEDIQLQVKKSSERVDMMALAVGTRPKSEIWNKEDKTKLYCTHCKRSGHDISRCFAVIGYPEWWGERNRGKNQQNNKKDNTRWTGNNNATRAAANIAAVVTDTTRALANVAAVSENHQSNTLSIKDRDSIMGLSDAQWARVVTLVNAGNNTSENISGPQFQDSDWSW